MDNTAMYSEIENRILSQKRAKRRVALLCCVCTLIAGITGVLLIMPADTQSQETFCGFEEHIHSDKCYEFIGEKQLICTVAEGAVTHEHADACYEDRQTLICGLAETAGHSHTDACYEQQDVLSCTLMETDGHTHTDACWGEERSLSCGREESSGHVHSDACYSSVTELTCTVPESAGHQHDASCYDAEGNLICTIAEGEGAHWHSDSCYTSQQVLTCGLAEGEGAHTHTDACYTVTSVLLCGQEEVPAHHHSEACYTKQPVLVCGQEACEPHTHADACYKVEKQLVCTESTEPHTHTDACYTGDKALVCGLPEHEHTLKCFSNPAANLENPDIWARLFEGLDLTGDWNKDVITVAASQLGYTESAANYEVDPDGTTIHGYTRYGAWYGYPYSEWCAMFCSFVFNYAEVDKEVMPYESVCTRWVDALSLRGLYHPAESGYSFRPGDLIFFDTDKDGLANHVGFVYKYDDVSGILTTIEGNRIKSVNTFEYYLDDEELLGYGELPQNPDYVPPEGETPAADAITVTEESITLTEDGATVSADGIALTEDNITVSADGANVTADAVTLTENAATVAADAVTLTEDGTTVSAEPTTEPMPAPVSHVLSYSGLDFTVTLVYSDDARIPADAYLKVREILPGTDEYVFYANNAASAMENASSADDFSFARFFDITIFSGDTEIEPAAPVSVTISYSDVVEIPEGNASAVHFAGNGSVEVKEASGTTQSVMEELSLPDISEEEQLPVQPQAESEFAFSAEAFSVWGTVIERVTVEGVAENVLSAERKVSSVPVIENGKITNVAPATSVTIKTGTYTIKTEAEADAKIPVRSADGSDNISLQAKDIKVTQDGADPSAPVKVPSLYNNLYFIKNYSETDAEYADEDIIKVSALQIVDGVLSPCGENGELITDTGRLVLVTDAALDTKNIDVKGLSVVYDKVVTPNSSGTGVQSPTYDSILQYDSTGALYSVPYKGYVGDVFRLSDYISGDDFCYISNYTADVDADGTGFIDNTLTDSTKPLGDLVKCEYAIFTENGIQPCKVENGKAVPDTSPIYNINDKLYKLAYTVNEMVKEHAEDDGKAYFWADSKYVAGAVTPTYEGYVGKSFTYHWDQWTYTGYFEKGVHGVYFVISQWVNGSEVKLRVWMKHNIDWDLNTSTDGFHADQVYNVYDIKGKNHDQEVNDNPSDYTAYLLSNKVDDGTYAWMQNWVKDAINWALDNVTPNTSKEKTITPNVTIDQTTYYLTGRVGDSYIPSDAVTADGKHLTTILYSAVGEQTKYVNTPELKTADNGIHKKYWMGLYPSDGGDKNGVKSGSFPGWHTTWFDTVKNASEYGTRDFPEYNIKNYLVLDSSWDKITAFEIKEEKNEKGEVTGVTLNAKRYKDPTDYPVTNSSLYIPTEIGTQAGKFLSYNINDSGTNGKALQLVSAKPAVLKAVLRQSEGKTQYSVDHAQMRLNGNVITEIDGKKYIGELTFQSGDVRVIYSEYGRIYCFDGSNTQDISDSVVNYLRKKLNNNSYSLNTNTLKDLRDTHDRIGDDDPDFWALGYWNHAEPDNPQEGKMYGFPKAFKEKSYIFDSSKVLISCKYKLNGTLAADDGSEKSVSNMEFKFTMDSDMLSQAYYACPRNVGYDIILDANAAFNTEVKNDGRLVIYKTWDDGEFSAFRPESLVVELQRCEKTKNHYWNGNWKKVADITLTAPESDAQKNSWHATYEIPSGDKDKYDYRVTNERMTLDEKLTFTPEYNGTSITNKVTSEMFDVTGEKLWQKVDGSPMLDDWPDSITLSLYQKKQKEDIDPNMTDEDYKKYLGDHFDFQTIEKPSDAEMRESDGAVWKWDFGEMPKYYASDDGELKEFVYNIVEVNVLKDEQDITDHYMDDNWEKSAQDLGDNTYQFVNHHRAVLSFKKTDEEGNPLPDTEFTLTGNDKTLILKSGEDGVLYQWDEEKERLSAVDTFTIVYDKLYTLQETKTPPGYNSVTLNIVNYSTDQGHTKGWNVMYPDGRPYENSIVTKAGDTSETYFALQVVDTHGFVLPKTGGPGTTLYYISGILLASGALIYGCIAYSKKREGRHVKT